jgi:hypothetical protein
MFNSVIIDVAIGLILSFLAVSLAASAITEAISSALQWRQATFRWRQSPAERSELRRPGASALQPCARQPPG